MAVQHKDLPDPELHEPKGVIGAAGGTVYVANGSSSCSWQKIASSSMKGLSGDGGSSGLVPVTDGTGGFSLIPHISYGVMGITNNSNNFATTAAADATLQSTADYVLFTGGGAPWTGELLHNVTFDTNKLTVPVNGVYNVRFWSNISGFPSNTALVGARFKVNNTSWSPRTVITKSNSAGDYGSMNAFGLVTLSAGDYVQLFVASSVTGNLMIKNANLTVELVRGT